MNATWYNGACSSPALFCSCRAGATEHCRTWPLRKDLERNRTFTHFFFWQLTSHFILFFFSNSSVFFPFSLAAFATFPFLWPEAQDSLLATSAALSQQGISGEVRIWHASGLSAWPSPIPNFLPFQGKEKKLLVFKLYKASHSCEKKKKLFLVC